MLGAALAKTFLWKLLLYGVVGYVAVCALVFLAQRKLIYLPSKHRNMLAEGFVEWRSPDGTEFWGYKRISGARECLFFFHGNGGNASGWTHAVANFPGDVYVLEYPRYGSRPGSPS